MAMRRNIKSYSAAISHNKGGQVPHPRRLASLNAASGSTSISISRSSYLIDLSFIFTLAEHTSSSMSLSLSLSPNPSPSPTPNSNTNVNSPPNLHRPTVGSALPAGPTRSATSGHRSGRSATVPVDTRLDPSGPRGPQRPLSIRSSANKWPWREPTRRRPNNKRAAS